MSRGRVAYLRGILFRVTSLFTPGPPTYPGKSYAAMLEHLEHTVKVMIDGPVIEGDVTIYAKATVGTGDCTQPPGMTGFFHGTQ